MYGEFVAEEPVTVTEHVELLPEALVSVQVGVGLKVTPAAEELNVTVPVGELLGPLPVSETVMVKPVEPPTVTVADVGDQAVLVERFGVRLKLAVTLWLFGTDRFKETVEKSGCVAWTVTVAGPLPGKLMGSEYDPPAPLVIEGVPLHPLVHVTVAPLIPAPPLLLVTVPATVPFPAARYGPMNGPP